MAEITAAAVKALREKTNLPMMECKQALQETGGDEAAAIDYLRKQGKKTMAGRAGRETAFGRMGVYADLGKKVGAMVELQCESAPVAGHEEFVALANDLAKQLALGPGAATADELFSQPSPSKPGKTLGEVRDDLVNRIREVFNLARMTRINGPTGGYSHHTGAHGVLFEIEGDNQALANELAMHVAAMSPAAMVKEDLDPALVAKEREILREAALKEGKPANIVDKMIDGRMRNFYAERVLTEQPFVKEEQKTVGKIAQEGGLKLKRFVHWQLGKS